MRLRTILESKIDSTLDERIRAMLCRCFPDAGDVFSESRAWHGSAPSWTVIAEDCGGTICGHLGIVDRVIRVGAEALRVAGIQNVCVLPTRRGDGVATRLLAMAGDLMRDHAFDAGLLFCTPALTRAYTACGWRLIDSASVTRTDEDGLESPLSEGSVAMWISVGIGKWPKGNIHLGGNDW